MYNINYFLDLQDQIMQRQASSSVGNQAINNVVLPKSSGEDTYFWIRQTIDPFLHKILYPNIPIRKEQKKDFSKWKIQHRIIFQEFDPYYEIRKASNPKLHKQIYG